MRRFSLSKIIEMFQKVTKGMIKKKMRDNNYIAYYYWKIISNFMIIDEI